MLDAGVGVLVDALVVDDGSEERWRATFEAVSRVPRARVLRREVNGGKGAALKAGFADALRCYPNLAGVVTADADGQHAAGDVARVARALADAPGTLVLGARTFGADAPLRSRFGNLLTRTLLRTITGVRLIDTQTGLRGWPRALVERSLHARGNRYEFELETLLGALDLPRIEVPIETIYIDQNRATHFRPIADSLRVYRTLLTSGWRRRR
jgi:glycosyltransferase involved in cell wall biosynthesis